MYHFIHETFPRIDCPFFVLQAKSICENCCLFVMLGDEALWISLLTIVTMTKRPLTIMKHTHLTYLQLLRATRKVSSYQFMPLRRRRTLWLKLSLKSQIGGCAVILLSSDVAANTCKFSLFWKLKNQVPEAGVQ